MSESSHTTTIPSAVPAAAASAITDEHTPTADTVPDDLRDLDRALLETVPWTVRKEGGPALQASLRALWVAAFRVGASVGPDSAQLQAEEEKRSREREEAYEAGLREGRSAATAAYAEGERKLIERAERAASRARKEVYAEAYEAGRRDEKAEADTRGEQAVESRRVNEEEEHELWEEAYEAGRLNASVAAAVDVEKALETERVWGFDVGWRLGTMKNATLSPNDVQTDTPNVVDTPISAVAAPLDWAEDASMLPTTPLPQPSPSSAVRDFSCLRSEAPAPFASIQRRRRRSPRQSRRPVHQNRGYSSATTRTPPNHYYRQPPPFLPPPSTRAFPLKDSASLDWDHDPRLSDLGRALTALGWIRPG
ncbi:hypothetical protein FB45DRAFT_1064731 [Roridomyces roridus]|uniref:Uncharacterized protein n=1 Tax=Roridomyces roridus TaxID=1738132 RepID=A0AAD7B990_9AGAR|nr:hypothetical protein FB45DRAFT_1064731 [Roridomyces roridus]